MLKLEQNETFRKSTIDLLVGGTPCQSFSLAGLRGGLADVRGNLSLEFCRLLIAKRPAWFLWENVPGVFSSFTDETEGDESEVWQTADFATLLAAFRECGYSCAWRVLDSQHFGVPQRRRRVFVVGHIGNDWRPSFAVLFERESLRRNFEKIKAPREEIAADAGKTIGSNGEWPAKIASTLNTRFGDKMGTENQHINQNAPLFVPHTAGTLTARGPYSFGAPEIDGNHVLASTFSAPAIGTFKEDNVAGTMVKHTGAGNGETQNPAFVSFHTRVRRLTPLECERLQGFPDHYTAIPGAKDGPRYKALGNSMTVNVMTWIGKRIDIVNKIEFKN